MARAKIIRQFPTALVENPLNFSLLLQRRLEILNIFSRRSIQYRIHAYTKDFMCEVDDLEASDESMFN